MPRPKKKPPSAPHAWIAEHGLTLVQVLSVEEAKDWRDRWRRIYARATKQKTGRWVNGGYDWHSFSFEHTKSVDLEAAKEHYRERRDTRLILLPDGHGSGRAEGLIVEGPPPDLGRTDYLVFPPNLDWTMAFTHEDGWLGPYYSCRDWVDDRGSTED